MDLGEIVKKAHKKIQKVHNFNPYCPKGEQRLPFREFTEKMQYEIQIQPLLSKGLVASQFAISQKMKRHQIQILNRF